MTQTRDKHGKRTPHQRERDRAITAELYLKGMPMRYIAEELGVSLNTIHRDIKKIEKEWKESAIRDFEAAKAEELHKINNLEHVAWKGYERSLEARKRKTIEKSSGPAGAGSKTSLNVDETPQGDVRYLDKVGWCIERRCKLLGLDAPSKVSRTTPGGESESSPEVVFYFPENGR